MNSQPFILQIIVSIFIENYASKRISRELVHSNKKSKKVYLYFVMFAFIMISTNLGIFYIFKQPNLYQELGVNRTMSLAELQNFGRQLQEQLMKNQSLSKKDKIKNVKFYKQKLNIISHPARRLTYDVFGQKDTQYAWAFKSQQFLNMSIVNSFINYLICMVMLMMSNKEENGLKQSLKLEIIVIILSLIWEIDLIINVETRLHTTQIDFIDYFYNCLPFFERRKLLHYLQITAMRIPQFFIKYLIFSKSQIKFKKLGMNQTIRNICSDVRKQMNKITIDQHLEDRVSVALCKAAEKQPLAAQIYGNFRETLKYLCILEGNNIFPDDQVNRILHYYIIKSRF